MNKDIDLIIDELLIERGEHPSRVRNPIYSEERELARKAVERILSEQCSRHECHEHTESPSPMEGKGLNLQKLSEKVDDALAKETEESLNEFLKEVKAKEEGKTPLKGWVKVYKDNIDGALLLGPVYPTKNHFSIFLNGITKPIACIDLSKHYEGEGL